MRGECAPLLKDNPLFADLEEEDVAALFEGAGARRKLVKTGEYVLHAGNTTREAGFVLAGSVLVVQEDLWGRRNIMAHVREGGIFAEVFAAAGVALNVSVVADEPGELVFVDLAQLMFPTKNSLQHTGRDGGRGGTRKDERAVHARNAADPGTIVARNLAGVLAKKTLAFNEKVTHLSRRSTREKLLSCLSAQAQRHGSRTFAVAFNRQQLADYLCVDRAAMCVELSKLQKDGLIAYKRNRFELKGGT